jgi:hypothetical protein
MFPTQCTSLISKETLSDDSLSQASQWLHECETDHAICNPEIAFGTRRPKILPTRLLDVGTESSPTTKLINSNEGPAGVAYFTLSHCWGGKVAIKLTSDCLDEFQTAIPFPTLPRTFQEAIYITRLLKTRYLWIDAMCIIQDSEKNWPMSHPSWVRCMPIRALPLRRPLHQIAMVAFAVKEIRD